MADAKQAANETGKDLRKSARVLDQARELGKAIEGDQGQSAFPCEFTASGNGKVVGSIEA